MYSTSFYIASYQFGHSRLILESLDGAQNLQIIFEGVEYFELNRIYYGLEIIPLTENEKDQLFEKRNQLRELKHCYLKIKSNEQIFFIACLAFKVIVENRIVLSDYVRQ